MPASSHPSIQSFYKREIPSTTAKLVSTSVKTSDHTPVGDGFTNAEIQAALDPLMREFEPEEEYEELDIGCLIPGPLRIKLDGRIVAFNVHHGKSKSQKAAKGWHHLIVKDDTGAICVTLYFASIPYQLHLGLLITIYTPFLCTTRKDDRFTVPNATLNTSIFPGRDPAVHLVLHHTSDAGVFFRKPLRYLQSPSPTPSDQGSQSEPRHADRVIPEPLQGLITLKNYLAGGHEIIDVKILVCVKVMGAKRTITNKKGGKSELQEVIIFDDTAETALTLWNEQLSSPKLWKPSETILLISSPGFRISEWGKTSLGLTWQTMVDVEPEFADADWLRRYARSLAKKDSVSQDFPEGVWNVEEAVGGKTRVLYAIGEFDERVRKQPDQIFTGYLSIIMLEVNLMLMRSRNMLLCGECCGLPLYSNITPSTCKNCDKSTHLLLNPNVVGILLDESGAICPGKLLWSPKAWEQLFGRSMEDLAALENRELKLLEQRMLCMRLTLVVGWKEEVGKLAVLAVMM